MAEKIVATLFVSKGDETPEPDINHISAWLTKLEIVRRIVKDPGHYLLRFPFKLIPARWILSDRAMRMLNDVMFEGPTHVVRPDKK